MGIFWPDFFFINVLDRPDFYNDTGDTPFIGTSKLYF